MGANISLRTLSCFARRGFNVGATCRCGHAGVVDAGKAAHWFMIHSWPSAVEVAGLHFRCSVCGRRGACRIVPVAAHVPLTFPAWGPQNDAAWRRRIRQLRG